MIIAQIILNFLNLSKSEYDYFIDFLFSYIGLGGLFLIL